MKLSLLSFKEITNELQSSHENNKKAIAFLPMGCIEQHGPFLPIETDSLIAESMSKDICEILPEEKYWGYTFPTVHYSPTRSNMGYPGSISIDENSFRSYVRHICLSILSYPFDILIVINAHGPSDPSLKEIAFCLIHEQFITKTKEVKPVIIVSMADCYVSIESQFKQKKGKHADWREFLGVYKILGKEYFTKDKMRNYKKFQKNNKFEVPIANVLGIPIEHRSVDGVIGEPLPLNNSDWESLSKDVWEYLRTYIKNKISIEMESFFEFLKSNPIKKK